MTDTERLIEEANGFYSASTEAMCLVANLAAALRAERERADKATLEALELKQRGRSLELVSADAIRERDELAAGLRSANALYETCKIDRDEYAAANLAANKRIVELEHERDAACAELARLTTPRPIVEAPTDKPVLGIWIDHRGNKCFEVLRWDGCWRGALGTPLYRKAECLPLPEVKP